MKIDINFLPKEYRPKLWVLPLTIGLIVGILALGYYGYGFLGKSAEAKGELESLQSQLDSVNAEIQQVMSDPTLKEYTELIAEKQSELDKLKVMEQDYETYNAERIRWKSALETVRELAPSDVVLTSFEQKGKDELNVEGELSGEEQNSMIVVEWARALENRDLFLPPVGIQFGTEERTTGKDSEKEEIITFILVLVVKPGGG